MTELYNTDPEFRQQINEERGHDNVGFCARFNTDGTGTVDTDREIVPFTWEATTDAAITFNGFRGKSNHYHVPVNDGKFSLNGDVYAKVSEEA